MIHQIDPESMMPSLCLSEKNLPDIKNWKVGEVYVMTLTVKQMSSSLDEYEQEKRKMPITARFRVQKVENATKAPAAVATTVNKAMEVMAKRAESEPEED